MGEQTAKASGLNRAKTYQLVLFPLNNGATNVYYVLVLSYIATFGSKVLALSMIFASVMVTGMRLFDAITDPIIGALMDRTNGRFGKFRPFMVIGNLIMAASILVLYCLTPLIPASSMGLRYAAFVALYAVWVIGYTFQTSCTRSGQTVLTNDPKQRPLFTIFNTVGSLLGMGAMQFFAPILAKNYEGGYASAGFFRTLAPVGIVISILLTILAIIGIWEKDQPKYFGIGGEVGEKVKLHEYVQIIKNNNPMQRLMVAGAGCYVFFILQGLVCFLVLAGSLLFAAMQARQRYEGTSITLRRLRRIQFFALACFVCAGVFMVEDCYHLLKPWFAQSISGYANYVNIFHNNWVVALLIGALLEMYTTHRIGHELRKEEQENHQ